MVGRLMNEHLALAEAGAFGTVDAQFPMHAAEQMVRRNDHIEAEARRGGAAVLASFQPHSDIVKNLALVINHRARRLIVAHHVDIVMHPVGVIRPENKAHVVKTVRRS